MFCIYSTARRPPSSYNIIPKHPFPSLSAAKTTGERVEDYFSGNSAAAAFPFLHSTHTLPYDNGCCCLGYCRRRRAPRRRRRRRSFACEIETHVCVRFARRQRAGIRTPSPPPLCCRFHPFAVGELICVGRSTRRADTYPPLSRHHRPSVMCAAYPHPFYI